MAAAHEQGLVHRDIKPSNLLLSQQGQLKVLDLGLAKSFSDDASSIQLTQAGRIVGTPDFMAPEQWDSSGAVDARTDLYALGCTLYYLLTGRTPFRTDSRSSLREIMTAHMLHPPPSLTELRPDVPAELDELYRRLMAKSPEGRIGSAQELARLLDSIARRLGGTAAVDPSFLSVLGDAETEVDRPRTTQQQEIKDAALSGRRHPTRDLIVAAVVCVAILFVACVAGFLLWAAVKLLLR